MNPVSSLKSTLTDYFRDFTVRLAQKSDYDGVEKLTKSIDLHDNLLKDLTQYNKAKRDDVRKITFT